MAGRKSKEKLVIIGVGETAELAYDYFSRGGVFEVVGFSAERDFIEKPVLLDLPVVPFEEIEKHYPPKSYKAFVAVSYTLLNRLRTRLYAATKAKGYFLCSYISPKAFINTSAEIGENCFVLEGVTIQRGAEIGNNVVLWSGSVVGHRSKIGANCFVAAHAVIPGFCIVEENCFLGVNCCVVNNTKIAKDCVIGAGAVVIHDTVEGKIYVGNPAKALSNKSSEVFVSGVETI